MQKCRYIRQICTPTAHHRTATDEAPEATADSNTCFWSDVAPGVTDTRCGLPPGGGPLGTVVVGVGTTVLTGVSGGTAVVVGGAVRAAWPRMSEPQPCSVTVSV